MQMEVDLIDGLASLEPDVADDIRNQRDRREAASSRARAAGSPTMATRVVKAASTSDIALADIVDAGDLVISSTNRRPRTTQ
jgi:hypothetical protein